MPKYINADDYKKLIEEEKAEVGPIEDKFENGCKLGMAIAVEILDEMPSADVVEVVRCKDCMYAIPDGKEYLCSAMTNPNYCQADCFCNYGERKESKIKKCFDIPKEVAEEVIQNGRY